MALDFFYIKAVKINECYTYKNLYFQIFEEKPLRHLIVTGKNGSGKTTILNRIAPNLKVSKAGDWQVVYDRLTKHSNESTVYQNSIASLKSMEERAEMVYWSICMTYFPMDSPKKKHLFTLTFKRLSGKPYYIPVSETITQAKGYFPDKH